MVAIAFLNANFLLFAMSFCRPNEVRALNGWFEFGGLDLAHVAGVAMRIPMGLVEMTHYFI